MTVDPLTAQGQVKYAGKSYFFCSPRCVTKFQQDPAKYLSAPLTGQAETFRIEPAVQVVRDAPILATRRTHQRPQLRLRGGNQKHPCSIIQHGRMR